MIPKSYGLSRADWRFFNVWIVVGMSLWALGTVLNAVFELHPPPKEYWEEFAHYDPAMVEGGIIRGTVRYENAADCTAKARARYHYEWRDIVGSLGVPADGINGPFIWGCQKVEKYDSRRYQDIRR